MRILKKTNLMIVGMVVIMAWVLSSSLAFADEEIENLVIGGDFEENADLTHWTLFLGGAAATMEIDKKEAAVGDASVFVDITGVDPAGPGEPQFRQAGAWGATIALESGVTYTASLFLKAEAERSIWMEVFSHTEGYVSRSSSVFRFGTEWEEYWDTFTMPNDASDLSVGIRWTNQGAGKISYWLDGIRFYEGEYVPTELDDVQKAVVTIRNKLSTTWGEVKAQY